LPVGANTPWQPSLATSGLFGISSNGGRLYGVSAG
jgi:hypothetical protein